MARKKQQKKEFGDFAGLAVANSLSDGFSVSNSVSDSVLGFGLGSFSTDNYSKKSVKNKENVIDISYTQAYQEDENNYDKNLDTKAKGTHWNFIVYPESAPENWIEQMINTGVSFAVSPLHDKDMNPTGEIKKAHYHMIVSYDSSVRYSAACGIRAITRGPYPLPCISVSGAYAYFTHKNNPEKYQYDTRDIRIFNGWTRKLEDSEVRAIQNELIRFCIVNGIKDYACLVVECMNMEESYYTVVKSNTFFFSEFLRSFRFSEIEVLKRYYNIIEDEEECEVIKKRIKETEIIKSKETVQGIKNPLSR